jgi:hypothetical protein
LQVGLTKRGEFSVSTYPTDLTHHRSRKDKNSPPVKVKRSEVIANVTRIREIRFEDQKETSLTSFAEIVIYQSLFGRMKLNVPLNQEQKTLKTR